LLNKDFINILKKFFSFKKKVDLRNLVSILWNSSFDNYILIWKAITFLPKLKPLVNEKIHESGIIDQIIFTTNQVGAKILKTQKYMDSRNWK